MNVNVYVRCLWGAGETCVILSDPRERKELKESELFK